MQGYNLMCCYYKMPIVNQSIDEEGWLHTGDLGYFDGDGYIHFVGRSKELIIRGGENIYPNEIAAVMMKEGHAFDEKAMREHLKPRLAKFKIPAHFVVYERFPVLSNGKVDAISLKKDLIAKIKFSQGV